MKYSKIMFAVAALAAGSAMAAPTVGRIAISSGASASLKTLELSLADRCTTAGGVQTVIYSSGTSTATNFVTFVCANTAVTAGSAGTYASKADSDFVNYSGSAIAEVRVNVAGGSFTAVCLLAGFPAATRCTVDGNGGAIAPDQWVNPASDTLATLEDAPAGSVIVGGLMDVEPTAFLASVRTGIANPASVISATVGQTFGVAVSNTLYNAMFADQKAAGLIPSTCNPTDYGISACVPVIGKAQMASIMSGSTGSDAYVRGANFLAPSQVTNPTPLTYARRVDTSGTQAAAQQYFLGNVCNSQGIAVVPEGGTANAITVQALASTGNVRTTLNSATNYSIGIMSGENNQASQNWKWIRVGGMPMSESAEVNNVSAITNTATALSGQYDYWFLSRIAKPNSTVPNAFWNAVIAGVGNVPAGTTKGVFKNTETKFTKGTTNSCKPVFTN